MKRAHVQPTCSPHTLSTLAQEKRGKCGFNTTHCHELSPLTSTVAADGTNYGLKTYQGQLSRSERAVFQEWAGCHMDIVKLEDVLCAKHPGTCYDYQLLYREKVKADNENRRLHGLSDMSGYMRTGQQILQQGGLFVNKVDCTQR
jgi:hypothetical protein